MLPALFHPELTLRTSEPRLRALLLALRVPPEIVALTGHPASMAAALFASPLPEATTALLHVVSLLGSTDGRDAIVEARASLDLPRAGCEDEPPADLAALAATLAETGDTDWQRIIERALLRLGRSLPARVGYEMWARRPVPLAMDALAKALAKIDLPPGVRSVSVMEPAPARRPPRFFASHPPRSASVSTFPKGGTSRGLPGTTHSTSR